ncbi:MAG: hypothetical protein ACR2PT_08060 [Endozoicomonas sp.]
MGDTEPKVFGAPAFSNNEILNARAWKVSAQIKLLKVAVHLGQKMLNAASTTLEDKIVDRLYMKQGEPCAGHFKLVIATSKLASAHCSKVLNLLELATHFRNIDGSPEEWQEHMECLKKGLSNPKFPRVPEFSAFNGEFFNCLEKLDELNHQIQWAEKHSKPSTVARLQALQAELTDRVQELFKSTIPRLNSITGYNKDEIVDMVFDTKQEFYTKGSWDQPEDKCEMRTMSIAEAHGFNDRAQLHQFLEGDIRQLSLNDSEALSEEEQSLLDTSDLIRNQNEQLSMVKPQPAVERSYSQDSGFCSDDNELGSLSDIGLGKEEDPESGNLELSV